MCNIGKPVREIIVVEPLKVPAPVPGTNVPEPKPTTPTVIPVPVHVEDGERVES